MIQYVVELFEKEFVQRSTTFYEVFTMSANKQ